MDETLTLNPRTGDYEGCSRVARTCIVVTPVALAAARQIGVSRAETNIHFFARLMQVDFWLHEPALLALPGVTITDLRP